MKRITLVSILALSAALLCLVFASCAAKPTEDDVVGTWAAQYTYNGVDRYINLNIHPDGKYDECSGAAGAAEVQTRTGTYKLNGNILERYPDGEVGMMPLTYKNGKLVSGDTYTLTKVG